MDSLGRDREKKRYASIYRAKGERFDTFYEKSGRIYFWAREIAKILILGDW